MKLFVIYIYVMAFTVLNSQRTAKFLEIISYSTYQDFLIADDNHML